MQVSVHSYKEIVEAKASAVPSGARGLMALSNGFHELLPSGDSNRLLTELDLLWARAGNDVSLLPTDVTSLSLRTTEDLKFGVGGLDHSLEYDSVLGHMNVKGRMWEFIAELQVNSNIKLPDDALTSYNTFYSSGVDGDTDWTDDTQLVSAKAIQALAISSDLELRSEF